MSRSAANRSFDVVLVAVWAALLLLLPLWPASFWYTLDSVTVTNNYTPEGYRVIEVEREVKRDFEGSWLVEEHRLLPSGKFTTVRACRGSAPYRTDKDLPDPLTQEWWRHGRDNCEWITPTRRKKDGFYRDCTWVTVHTGLVGDKKVPPVCSNTYIYQENKP